MDLIKILLVSNDRFSFEFQYDLQLVNNVYPVMTKDSLLTSHAISTPIRDPDDIPQFFDSISYDKASSSVYHLMISPNGQLVSPLQ